MVEVIYTYGMAAYFVLELILVTVFLITFWSIDRTKKSKKSLQKRFTQAKNSGRMVQ